MPVIIGTEGEKAVDISRLRQETGFITYDPGYANTGSCKSAITFMDGEKGILRYRGIPVDELADNSSFVETVYLLIHGVQPTRRELNHFSILLNDHSLVYEDMQDFFQTFPRASHPMAVLSSMVKALRSFYPEPTTKEEEMNMIVTHLLSKVRTKAAMSVMPKVVTAEFFRRGLANKIRCVAVAPGYVGTSMVKSMSEKVLEKILSQVPTSVK